MAVPFAEPRRTSVATSELVAAGAVVALAGAFVLSPHHIEDGPVICPFRRLTGLPCPGCGLTRSWVYLAHGWWRDALLANPFGAVAAVLAVLLAVTVVRSRVRGTPSPDLERLTRRPWARAIIAAWLLFGVVRIVVVLAGG